MYRYLINKYLEFSVELYCKKLQDRKEEWMDKL